MPRSENRSLRLSQALPSFTDEYEGEKLRQMVRILEAPVPQEYVDDDVVTVDSSMSPYNIGPGVRLILADCTGGNIVLNRPFAIDHPRRPIGVVKVDASGNTVTDTPQPGDTINGAASRVVTTQYSGHDAYSNGMTGWFVLP